jgi:hypothetical protein
MLYVIDSYHGVPDMILPVFTVRNASGQFLGTYRAKNARQAIQKLVDEQATYNATFHSQSIELGELSAAVEEPR